MNIENYLVILAIFIGPIFIIAGSMMYFFPPKKINPLYGYRTKNSMKNEHNWHLSQKYSGKCMIISGILYSLTLLGLSLFISDEIITIFLGIGLLIPAALLIFYFVEKKLKESNKNQQV